MQKEESSPSLGTSCSPALPNYLTAPEVRILLPASAPPSYKQVKWLRAPLNSKKQRISMAPILPQSLVQIFSPHIAKPIVVHGRN